MWKPNSNRRNAIPLQSKFLLTTCVTTSLGSNFGFRVVQGARVCVFDGFGVLAFQRLGLGALGLWFRGPGDTISGGPPSQCRVLLLYFARPVSCSVFLSSFYFSLAKSLTPAPPPQQNYYFQHPHPVPKTQAQAFKLARLGRVHVPGFFLLPC